MTKPVDAASKVEAPSAEAPASEPLKPAQAKRVRRRLQFIRGPSVFHSAMYGVVTGVIFYGGYFMWRAFKLENCNTEYFARQSRWRHFEKQQLFQRELSQKMNAHFVASLAQEYDPVALRKPDSPLDPKHNF